MCVWVVVKAGNRAGSSIWADPHTGEYVTCTVAA